MGRYDTAINRMTSEYGIVLSFSPKGITTAAVQDDGSGTTIAEFSSDDMHEALDMASYHIDQLVEERYAREEERRAAWGEE